MCVPSFLCHYHQEYGTFTYEKCHTHGYAWFVNFQFYKNYFFIIINYSMTETELDMQKQK